MVKRPLLAMSLSVLCLNFIGCSTAPTTAPVTEAGGEVRESDEPSVQPNVQSPPDAQSIPPKQDNRVLESLVDKSRQLQRQQRWYDAIGFAERGLRIDRREPKLYLIISESYQALGQLLRSRQFAEIGLRYSEPGSDSEASFRRLLSRLTE